MWQDVAAARGLEFTHRTGVPRELNIIQVTGSGCAFLDSDDDGWLDLFLVQGDTVSGGSSRLFRNLQGLRFKDVTQEAGIRTDAFGLGCAVGDYDGDGRQDLYVCNYGRNRLYRNAGGGKFRDVTTAAGVGLSGCSVSAAFLDADNDGDLDLYVARYVHFAPEERDLCVFGEVRASCPPRYYAAEPDVFYRNCGDGTFEEATAAAGFRDTNGRGLGVAPADFDNDGDQDLYVANDGTANYLWVNDGKGRFADQAVVLGAAFNPHGKGEASMGLAWGDVDGDGRQDMAIGNFQNEPDSLYLNRADEGMVWHSAQAGLAEPTLPVLTWGLGLLDCDNDGDLDLMQVNGHVQDRITEIDPECTFAQPRQLFLNNGQGKFIDWTARCGPVFTQAAVGRGLALGDFDNDGRLDALVNNLGGPAMLLRNNSPASNWLALDLRSKSRNTRALGARVKCVSQGRVQWREVTQSGGYAGSNDPRGHFGLGPASGCSVEIRWPSGKKTHLQSVKPNQILKVTEPD
jgi:enediyne biosynthesis protein E4